MRRPLLGLLRPLLDLLKPLICLLQRPLALLALDHQAALGLLDLAGGGPALTTELLVGPRDPLLGVLETAPASAPKRSSTSARARSSASRRA